MKKYEEKMTYKEFKEIYSKPNKIWDFKKFKIECVKCKSKRVEFNSNMELEHGYYDDYSVEGKIIVKCHKCGNAFTLDFWEIRK